MKQMIYLKHIKSIIINTQKAIINNLNLFLLLLLIYLKEKRKKITLIVTMKKKNSKKNLRAFYFPKSIGVLPTLIKYSFVFEKGLLPKKPLYAESGDGCADSII